MKLKFIAEKYLKTATGKNKLVTDNSIQANHLNIGKYVEETYMKQFHGRVRITSQEATVTIPVEMENTDYNIQLTMEVPDGIGTEVGKRVCFVKSGSRSKTGFTIKLHTALNNLVGEYVDVFWKVLN